MIYEIVNLGSWCCRLQSLQAELGGLFSQSTSLCPTATPTGKTLAFSSVLGSMGGRYLVGAGRKLSGGRKLSTICDFLLFG